MAKHVESEPASTHAKLGLCVVEDYNALSRAAADVVQRVVESSPGAAITLPTGSTPKGMFEELARRIVTGELDFSGAQVFCLDDYLGVSPDDEVSLTGWLEQVFLTPAGLPRDHIHLIPCTDPNPEAAAEEYEQSLREHGGLRLAVVGIGPNGHVGFNEPGSPPDSRTRVVNLTEESRELNAAYYPGRPEIPPQAMTMGLGTILEARQIVLIVSGSNKAAVLKAALEGPETTDVPASFLRTAGSRLLVIADRAATSLLTNAYHCPESDLT